MYQLKPKLTVVSQMPDAQYQRFKEFREFILKRLGHEIFHGFDVEDIAQEVLIRVFRNPEVSTYSTARAKAWISTCIRFEKLRLLNKHRREVCTEFDMFEEESNSQFIHDDFAHDERFIPKDIFSGMSKNQILVLVLRAEGWDHDEICGATGFTYTQVQSFLRWARRKAVLLLSGKSPAEDQKKIWEERKARAAQDEEYSKQQKQARKDFMRKLRDNPVRYEEHKRYRRELMRKKRAAKRV